MAGGGALTWPRPGLKRAAEAELTSLHCEDTMEAVSTSLRLISAPENEMFDCDAAGDIQGVLSTLPYLDTGGYFMAVNM